MMKNEAGKIFLLFLSGGNNVQSQIECNWNDQPLSRKNQVEKPLAVHASQAL